MKNSIYIAENYKIQIDYEKMQGKKNIGLEMIHKRVQLIDPTK